jgi:hypothetical protein
MHAGGGALVVLISIFSSLTRDMSGNGDEDMVVVVLNGRWFS